jgi:hypothetical protein
MAEALHSILVPGPGLPRAIGDGWPAVWAAGYLAETEVGEGISGAGTLVSAISFSGAASVGLTAQGATGVAFASEGTTEVAITGAGQVALGFEIAGAGSLSITAEGGMAVSPDVSATADVGLNASGSHGAVLDYAAECLVGLEGEGATWSVPRWYGSVAAVMAAIECVGEWSASIQFQVTAVRTRRHRRLTVRGRPVATGWRYRSGGGN